jgi:hypothetical protein
VDITKYKGSPAAAILSFAIAGPRHNSVVNDRIELPSLYFEASTLKAAITLEQDLVA